MGHITDVLHFYICKHVLEIILAKNKNLMKDETYFGTLKSFCSGKIPWKSKCFTKVIITVVLRIDLGVPRGFGCVAASILPVLQSLNNGNI